MRISIEIQTPLSPEDKALLRGLAGDAAPWAVTVVADQAPPTAEAPPAAEKPKRAKAEPAPAAEEAPPGDVPSMSDAVTLATEYVSTGKSALVKAALTDLGAARVSELKDADIPKFMAALTSLV